MSRNDRLCHICSFNVVEDEAHFVMECPLYIFVRKNFLSRFENVVLGRLESFFQLDHQVDISLYLKEYTALRHSRKLGFLTTSWYIFSLISLLASWTLNLISSHSIGFHGPWFCVGPTFFFIDLTQYSINHETLFTCYHVGCHVNFLIHLNYFGSSRSLASWPIT